MPTTRLIRFSLPLRMTRIMHDPLMRKPACLLDFIHAIAAVQGSPCAPRGVARGRNARFLSPTRRENRVLEGSVVTFRKA